MTFAQPEVRLLVTGGRQALAISIHEQAPHNNRFLLCCSIYGSWSWGPWRRSRSDGGQVRAAGDTA
jgi:hypothetical protein